MARVQEQRERDEWRGNVLCRYYATDSCRNGAGCPYSHDRSLSNRGTLPCKFFAQGTCAYGENCRFSHGSDSSSGVAAGGGGGAPSGSPSRSKVGPEAPSNGDDDDLWSRLDSVRLGNSGKKDLPAGRPSRSWADAPEFVPAALRDLEGDDGQGIAAAAAAAATAPSTSTSVVDGRTWATVVNPTAMAEMTVADAESSLCPFSLMDECRYGEHCAYVHGDICDLCGCPALHPDHAQQRKLHQDACMKQHEAAMELAFAMAKSKDKTCGICMEVVMEKPKFEARFGIMPNCNHCYCLSCLRKWRQVKQFEKGIIRACPECRQTSNYICPSKFWVDTKEEKDKLFGSYKTALNKKPCKYLKNKEKCPFGPSCFYHHDKELEEAAEREHQRQARTTQGGTTSSSSSSSRHHLASLNLQLMQEYLEYRSNRLLSLVDFLDDVLSSDDDDEDFVLS